MASYNKYDRPLFRDVLVVPLACFFVSLFAGATVFAVIGHQMHVEGVNAIQRLRHYGPGISLIVYSEALVKIPGAAICSVFFFAMLFVLGLASQFIHLDVLTTGFSELFPEDIRRCRLLLLLGVIFIEAFLGLVFLTQGGFHLFRVVDWYAAAFGVLIVGFLELLSVCLVYGIRRLLIDVQGMLGELRTITKVCWGALLLILSPLMFILAIASSTVTFTTQLDENQAVLPIWSIAIGWLIVILSTIGLPITLIYKLSVQKCDPHKLILPSEEYTSHVADRRTRHKSELLNAAGNL
ncbi:solute carrier family 6 (neurotransmitter transporter) member 14 [Clonorchis sinensis]|uniref:Solute carrier family 6 (Neurotransmitter transporter) member 14 n=2 Tax=Clonorchis sinensis TaxID=79923 RepID=G7YHI5_CLOSI|nr:solute carrier family 6 (neurotransmitter transporter) member 14 [Clonorchis sinensis]